MEVTDRFLALVADPASQPPLDEAAFLVAAHAAPGLDVDAGLARLDDLAARAHEPRAADRTAATLARRIFGEWGFTGNRRDYSDPRNSLIDQVLDRRLGIPISLGIVMIEIGRRIGVGLHGVGMPGHFLVGITGDPDRFVDPFNGGALLDRAGCRRRFLELQGHGARFRDEHLAPTPNRAVVLRVLNNLERVYADRRSGDARWVVRLRLGFPELPAGERRRAAALLGALGAFREGAAVLDAVAARAGADEVDAIAAEARALRARAN
jgi:regulator of sirC expression with transglutaminase-like and TPR domain